MNKINPIRAYLSVPWAFLTFSGLPNEVRYLNAPTTNIMNRISMTRADDIKSILPKTISRHLKVGIPSGVTQVPQFLIWALTTKEVNMNQGPAGCNKAGMVIGQDKPRQRLLPKTICSSVTMIANTATMRINPRTAAVILSRALSTFSLFPPDEKGYD